VVFVSPMLGTDGGTANAAVAIGYTIADFVAKAVLAVLIYMIAVRKSAADGFYETGVLPAPARASAPGPRRHALAWSAALPGDGLCRPPHGSK